MKNKRDTKKELKQYYKYVYTCKDCGRNYGSDEKDEDLKCPACLNDPVLKKLSLKSSSNKAK